MKRKELIFWAGAAMLAFGFIFQFGETWYFGWNLRAESIEEAWCDFAAAAIRYAGLIAIAYATLVMPTEMTHTFIVKRGDDVGQ